MSISAEGTSLPRKLGALIIIACTSTLFAPTKTLGHNHRPVTFPIHGRQSGTQQHNPSDVRELTPGIPIERELSAGEADSYRITLSPGQYVHVTAQQLGVNVELTLSDPSGKRVASIDWQWREGAESLWVSAESQGEYVLKVYAADEPAERGSYRVKLEKVGELSQATANEREMVAAHRAYAEGGRLLSRPTPESLREAAAKMGEALSLWRSLGDADAQAHALYKLGDISFQEGNLKQAPEYLNQAIPLFQASGNRYGEAVALESLGDVYSFSGETQKGLESYNRALSLARAINNRFVEPDVLGGLGLVFQNLGQTPKALETLDLAISVAHAAGYAAGEAAAHNNVGLVYVSLGRLRDAVEQYRQSLALQRAGENLLGQATVFNNIGNAYTRMGEFQKALEFLTEGLELKRRIGDKRGEAANLGSIGFLYIALGDYQRALQYYSEALTLSRAVENHAFALAALLNLGTIYFRTGDLPKSLDYFNQALALATLPADLNAKAFILTGLGSISARSGDTRKALDYYERALSIRRERGSQYGEAQVLSLVGATYAQQGEGEKALDYLTRALTLSKSIDDRLGEASTLYQLARLARDRGNVAEARSRAEAALAVVESVRAKVTLSDSRSTFFAAQQGYYDFYIDLLMQSYKSGGGEKYLADALLANERRSARSLLDSLAEARADIRVGVPPELVERERNLRQDLNAKADQQTRLLSQKHTAEQASDLAREIGALTAEYEQALALIRTDSPRYAALTQPQPLSPEEIQRTLDADTVLLEYALGEERSYLWAVTPESISGFELPKRSVIEAQARAVYESLTARNRVVRFEKPDERRARVARSDADYSKAASELSRTVLSPLVNRLGKKRLLLVSEGALQYVPFGALPAPAGASGVRSSGVEETKAGPAVGGQPLILNHEIVALPSASALAVLREEMTSRRRGSKIVAVLADPVFEPDDPRVKTAQSGARSVAVAQSDAGEQSDARGSSNERDGIADESIPPDGALERSARDFGQRQFPRLPYTRREADAIVSLAPKASGRESLDFEASRTAAVSPELADYRIVHFATHALLNAEHPELSGVVLSLVDKDGRPQDGFLRLNEIYNMKLGADLVVLSACRTALGKEVRGEGLVGLARGFMYAGSPRVVASLWAVDDEATVELMKTFYREMLLKGQRPAAALRAAQVSVWRRLHLPPYYWAAFVLQGEWK